MSVNKVFDFFLLLGKLKVRDRTSLKAYINEVITLLKYNLHKLFALCHKKIAFIAVMLAHSDEPKL